MKTYRVHNRRANLFITILTVFRIKFLQYKWISKEENGANIIFVIVVHTTFKHIDFMILEKHIHVLSLNCKFTAYWHMEEKQFFWVWQHRFFQRQQQHNEP